MAIGPDSRYAASTVVKLTDASGAVRYTIVPSHQQDFTVTFTYHQMSGAERIDLLAYEYYNDEGKWYMIADANPEIMDWDNLDPGVIIRIPNI